MSAGFSFCHFVIYKIKNNIFRSINIYIIYRTFFVSKIENDKNDFDKNNKIQIS